VYTYTCINVLYLKTLLSVIVETNTIRAHTNTKFGLFVVSQ